MRIDITERTGNKRSGVWCPVRWQISHFFGDLGKEWVLTALLSLGASNLCEVAEAGRWESLRIACKLGSESAEAIRGECEGESRQEGLSGSVWQDLCWAGVLRRKKIWPNARAVFVNLSKALKGKSSSWKQWTVVGVQVIPTVSFPVEKGQRMCYQTRGSQLMP